MTGLYTTSSVAACQHILENSQAQIVIVDDKIQLGKISEIKSNLPHLLSVIETENWDDLISSEITDDVKAEYEKRLKEIIPNQCCSIIYTSGTSGFPKGAMLSHDNLIWDATESVKSFLNMHEIMHGGNEAIISYLPLSHLAAFMLDLFIATHVAGTVYFAEITALKANLLQYLQEVEPTIFTAVPRVYEKIEQKVKENLEQLNFFKRKLFSWAQNVIREEHLMRLKSDEKQSSSLKMSIAQHLVSQPVKALLGFKRCKILTTGSAPISEETKLFFMSLDIFLTELYGMTESSCIHSVPPPYKIPSLKTVGKNLSTAKTKICNANEVGEGEICIKGRHVFMGYLNDIEKTLETIDDDKWLHTGDIGMIDEDEFIFIKGRIKEILITSGGENIAAALIESIVKNECNAISNAFLVGDKRKYLTLLLTFKTMMNEDGSPHDDLASETLNWLKSQNIHHQKMGEIEDDLRVKDALQDVINRVNSKAISNPHKIQKFAILPHDFSMITGELTPTMKVRRHVVLEKYQTVIDKLYS